MSEAGTTTTQTARFLSPEASLDGMDALATARAISVAADIALILEPAGVIIDFASSVPESRRGSLGSWVGRPWPETVAEDSVPKVEALLREASEPDGVSRAREVNQRVDGGPDLPFRYNVVRLDGTGRLLAIGRDLRVIASLQQQLVGAQQSMEREYARLRHLETRYRLLFQISSEPVLIVDAQSERLTQVNPAAGNLLGDSAPRLIGRGLSSLFAGDDWETVRSMLDETRVAGVGREVSARLHDGASVAVFASLFRQDNSTSFLIRFAGGDTPKSDRSDSRLLEALRYLPDAFVVVDSDRRVVSGNAAFLDLVQLATEQQARRVPLEEWLGRPGVDLNILMANLREHGSVRNFATVVRGQFGSSEEVEVSGVAVMDGSDAVFGFMIRPVSGRTGPDLPLEGELPSSVQQLTGMVGRVPLKEIIRKTTDVIESLCIEAALEVSGDNRASAAQMLGLSRQSLYAKLRRHGLGDLEPTGGGDP